MPTSVTCVKRIRFFFKSSDRIMKRVITTDLCFTFFTEVKNVLNEEDIRPSIWLVFVKVGREVY
jgi:hypothetical protein